MEGLHERLWCGKIAKMIRGSRLTDDLQDRKNPDVVFTSPARHDTHYNASFYVQDGVAQLKNSGRRLEKEAGLPLTLDHSRLVQ